LVAQVTPVRPHGTHNRPPPSVASLADTTEPPASGVVLLERYVQTRCRREYQQAEIGRNLRLDLEDVRVRGRVPLLQGSRPLLRDPPDLLAGAVAEGEVPRDPVLT